MNTVGLLGWLAWAVQVLMVSQGSPGPRAPLGTQVRDTPGQVSSHPKSLVPLRSLHLRLAGICTHGTGPQSSVHPAITFKALPSILSHSQYLHGHWDTPTSVATPVGSHHRVAPRRYGSFQAAMTNRVSPMSPRPCDGQKHI